MRKLIDLKILHQFALSLDECGITFEETSRISEHLLIMEHMMFTYGGAWTTQDIADHKENLHYVREDLVAIMDKHCEEEEQW